MAKRTPTISDIAKATNSSVSTVSRVLSKSDYPVSEKKRQQIESVAKEMGYVPNIFGRMLKNNVNQSVGIIVPTLQNPFFMQIIIGAEQEALKRGYELVFFSSHRDPLMERKLINGLLQKRIMGLMLVSIDDSSEALRAYLDAGGKACIIEADFTLPNTIRTKTDFSESGYIAMHHLLSKGHRDIALLFTPLTKSGRRLSIEGCRRAMQEIGLSLSDDDIYIAPTENDSQEGMYEFETGRMLAAQLLLQPKRYTAIIATNDLTAFGIIQELTSQGYSVPEHISVIGMDDIVYSSMLTPPLTTVHQPSNKKGQVACMLLINAMELNDETPEVVVSFPPHLCERGSVAPPCTAAKDFE